MSTPFERVTEFLRQWAIPRDKSDLIYGVLFDNAKDEHADLLASDLRELLEEVELARNIISTVHEDSPVTISGFDFEAAVPGDTEVRFYLSPDIDDAVSVRADPEGFLVLSTGPGRSLSTRPTNQQGFTVRIERL